MALPFSNTVDRTLERLRTAFVETARGAREVVGAPLRPDLPDDDIPRLKSRIAACLAGQGVFQSLAIGLAPLLARGELVQILPEWSDELFPLYAYQPSRHLPPAKVRALLDFIQEIAVGA